MFRTDRLLGVIPLDWRFELTQFPICPGPAEVALDAVRPPGPGAAPGLAGGAAGVTTGAGRGSTSRRACLQEIRGS
jgi:hypothetical protein